MIADIVKKTETLAPNDTLGKAVAKLSNALALAVIDKSYQGMLYLRELVVRDVDTNTKIGPLVKKPQKIQLNAGQEEIMKAFMEYPVLPVFEKEAYTGTITINDFIGTLKLKGKACEYAVETEIVCPDDDMGVARNALKKNDVVLVKDGGRLLGAVDVFSLAKQITSKRSEPLLQEKIPERKIGINTVMANAIEINIDTDIHKALDLLKTNSFLVCGDYVITPKTILASIRSEKEERRNQILELVGFDFANQGDGEVTSFEGSIVIKEIENFASRTEKIFKPNEIKFNLQVSQKPGKDLYELYAKVMAGGRAINAHVQGYKIIDLVQDAIGKLEIQLEKIKVQEDDRIRNLKRRPEK